MPEIRAFRGLRYNPGKVHDLSSVTAPPYDVIDERQRAKLAARDEHNVVQLILPVDEADKDRYSHAAELLERWLTEGVLVQDAKPGIYVVRQEWQLGEKHYERTGFVAAVTLERFGEGKIYPHENTLSAPKADRLELLKATQTNFSQVFGIFPDETHDVDAWLARSTSGKPSAEATDDAGVVTRLWCEFDEARIAELQHMMTDREIFIADGHHRYETALAYQEFCRMNAPLTDAAPQNALMMLCVAMTNQGLVTFPTHRLLGAAVAAPDHLIRRLKELFCVHPIATFSGSNGELDAVLESDASPNLILLYVGKDRPPMTISPRKGTELLSNMSGHSETWRSLDVSILQYEVFERLLGLTLQHITAGDKIGYVHEADDARARVDRGEFAAAFILRPTPVAAVAAVAANHEKMPPKSTFFYPKALTGMVLRRLQDG